MLKFCGFFIPFFVPCHNGPLSLSAQLTLNFFFFDSRTNYCHRYAGLAMLEQMVREENQVFVFIFVWILSGIQ